MAVVCLNNNYGNKYHHLTMYLTRNCNLNCSYCFCGKKYHDDMDSKTSDDILHFFDFISTPKASIAFFGGEPLLKLDLIRHIVSMNKSRYSNRFNFSITTNGTLLTKSVFEYLKEENVSIIISIDGNKASHDKNRCFYSGEGSWETIMNNTYGFRDKLPVRLTFTPLTVNNLSDDVCSLYDLGFRNVAFYPAGGQQWGMQKINSFCEQLKRISKYMIQAYRKGYELGSHWLDKSIYRHISGVNSTCKPGVDQISVTPDGSIFPCNMTNFTEKKLYLGSIYSGINNKKVDELRKAYSIVDPECKDCEIRDRCNYCYMDIFNETGSFWRIPEWFCYMNQEVIKSADQMASTLYQEKNEIFRKKFYFENVRNES